MRPVLALALTTFVALGAPAFAQSAGDPGAVGTGGGLSGSNTPGNGVYAPGTAADPRVTNGDDLARPGMTEGRAAAPDYGMDPPGANNLAPGTVKGDQVQQTR